MARMRTISQVIEYFHEKDRDTAVTEFWLRNLLHSGAVPYHKAGKKFIVNLDAIEAFLENPPAIETDTKQQSYGKIRAVR